MKDLKEFILERRIGMLQVDGKKVPEQYIQIFNDYLKEIAEELAEHDKQAKKEVVQDIRQQLKEVERFHPEDEFEIDYDYYYKEDVDGILEKVEKGK
jgi:molecular chaperone DnaK (HSP70)